MIPEFINFGCLILMIGWDNKKRKKEEGYLSTIDE
jgi:hypothetical protein